MYSKSNGKNEMSSARKKNYRSISRIAGWEKADHTITDRYAMLGGRHSELYVDFTQSSKADNIDFFP